MHNYKVAACKHVYSKKQLQGGKFGIFSARWLEKSEVAYVVHHIARKH